MDDNRYTTIPDLNPPKQRAESPTDHLTLDPFGTREEVERAAQSVVPPIAEEPVPTYTERDPQAKNAQENLNPPQQNTYVQPLFQPNDAEQQNVDAAQPNNSYNEPYYPPQQLNYGTQYQQPQMYRSAYTPKSKIAAGLLGIFLGGFGVHNFYLGYTGKAIAQLLMTVLSCGVLSFASGIWGFIEGILILTGNINTDGNGQRLQD